MAFKGNLVKVVGGAVIVVPIAYWLLHESFVVSIILLIAVVIVLGTLLAVAFKEGKVQREQMFVLLILWVFHMCFWMFFEQAGTSLTLFTDRNIDRDIAGFEFSAAWGQFFNPFFILTFGTLFTLMWVRLDKIGKDPSIPTKFGLGLIQLGLGFGVLVFGASLVPDTGLVSLLLLVFCYMLHTTGELCLSPVGLSAVTKLAPKRMTGMVMGAWFLSIAAAHKLAAFIAGETSVEKILDAEGNEVIPPATETLSIYTDMFWQIMLFAVGAGLLLIMLGPLFLKRWLHGVK